MHDNSELVTKDWVISTWKQLICFWHLIFWLFNKTKVFRSQVYINITTNNFPFTVMFVLKCKCNFLTTTNYVASQFFLHFLKSFLRYSETGLLRCDDKVFNTDYNSQKAPKNSLLCFAFYWQAKHGYPGFIPIWSTEVFLFIQYEFFIFSASAPLACGVPQGSVFFLFCFNLYLLSYGSICRTHNITFYCVADHIQVYLPINPETKKYIISCLNYCNAL